MAQVHKAQLRETREEVAVKLQYPFLKVQTDYDLFIIELLIKISNKLLKLNEYKDLDLVKQFDNFQKYLIEVRNDIIMNFRNWILREKRGTQIEQRKT